MPPLPHHRAYGSVPRRFGGSGFADSRRHRRTFACGGRRGHLHQLVPGQTGGSPRRLEIAPHCGGFAVFRGSRDLCATRPLLQPLAGTVRAFSRWSGLIRPLLTSVRRSGGLATPSVPRDTGQISWGKSSSFPRTPAGFTALALDGYGLCDSVPARPTKPASVSDFCSSGCDFAPRFLQTVPRGSALALHSCFTSIRLHRGLSPPSCWACPAHTGGCSPCSSRPQKRAGLRVAALPPRCRAAPLPRSARRGFRVVSGRGAPRQIDARARRAASNKELRFGVPG